MNESERASALAELGLTDRQPGIGDLVMTLGNVAPLGCLKLNGVSLSRVTYAGLWAWVQANTNLITDSAWTGGATAAFSQGDGSSTFRIPDFRGEMLRMWDDGRSLDNGRGIGTIQSANLPDHYHRMPIGFDGNLLYGWGDANYNPLFGSQVISGATASQVSMNDKAASRAIRVASTDAAITPGAGEIRPRNVSPLACIRYK